MAQKSPKSEISERDGHKCGLAKIGVEAAAIARRRTVLSESAEGPANTPERKTLKAPGSVTPPVAAPRRKLQSQPNSVGKEVPKPLPRVKSADFSKSRAPGHMQKQSPLPVVQKHPPPQVAPKPDKSVFYQLKQSPVNTKESMNSKISTLPQNWKLTDGFQPSDSSADKNEDVNSYATTEGETLSVVIWLKMYQTYIL